MSGIAPFALEQYFARHEFSTEILMCSSDVDGLPMRQLLDWADDEMLGLWRNQTMGYTESTGHPLLRREIKRLYQTLSEDDIAVTAGAEEPIYIAMRLLLQPGDHAIVTWPGYQSHYEIARSIGCELTLLPVRPMGHRWKSSKHWMIDVGELRSAIRHNTKLIVTCFPHNPTGALPTHEEWREIAQVIAEHDVRWLSDESFRFLEYQPSDRLPSAADLNAKALVIGGMAKTFAMAGARIAWAATHDRTLLNRLVGYKHYTTICSSGPAELLSIMALRAKQKVLARNLGIIKTNLARANAFFETHESAFGWTPPSAGTMGFVQLKRADADVFAEAFLKAKNALLLPASVFDYPYSYFRLGLGRTNLDQGLGRLGEFQAEFQISNFKLQIDD
jgi:aspartate/methionine/tyrosine aminotransferase